MTNRAEIDRLAQKYSLKEGKFEDFYNSHGKWCVTKQGAHKIAQQDGITMKVDAVDITPVSIAYRGTFTNSQGETLQEVGSCRWDYGTKVYEVVDDRGNRERHQAPRKNNPEATHAPEMAWKRLHVRGILAFASPTGGVYGAEEFNSDWHRQGNGNGNGNGGGWQQPQGNQPQPQPRPAQRPPAQQPQQQQQRDSHVDYTEVPQRCLNAQGWFASAAKLPNDWAQLMAKLCEIARCERSMWERLLIDHAGKYHGDRGWWLPSQSYQSFNQIVFHVDERQNKSKAGFALRIVKEVRELVNTLEEQGACRIEVPDETGNMLAYQINCAGGDTGPASADPAVQAAVEGAAAASTAPPAHQPNPDYAPGHEPQPRDYFPDDAPF